MRKAVFLDRDGTLIDNKHGYLYKIEDCEILPGVVEGLRVLKDEYLFFIVTNQSGIGRGYYSEEDFWGFQNHLVEVLGREGIHIESTVFCPHHPDAGCDCRKPKSTLILLLAEKYNIDLLQSWYIGDSDADKGTALEASVRYISVATESASQTVTGQIWCAQDIHTASEIIKTNHT